MDAEDRRFALLLEYDGAAYVGSQYQVNGPTIQAALEAAIQRFSGEHRRVAFAGRTDSGVHAYGQVAAFSSRCDRPVDVVQRALNALLPEDIAVRAVSQVPPNFDPRRWARSRWYRYAIYNAAVRSPLQRRYTWQVPDALDLAAMREAAAWLVGERDYAAFAGLAGRSGAGTVRRITRAELHRSGKLILFDIEANAFLPQQVRRTIGTLVQVGSGRLAVEEFITRAEAAMPNTLGPVAPPQGLCLISVRYEDDWFPEVQQSNIDWPPRVGRL